MLWDEPQPVAVRAVDGFAEFWAPYPNKVAKIAAERAFKKLRPSADTMRLILADIVKRKACEAAAKQAGAFWPAWPYPATYLHGQRWLDEHTTEAINGNGTGHLGAGRIAVDQAALDQDAERRRQQKARDDAYADKSRAAGSVTGSGGDSSWLAGED